MRCNSVAEIAEVSEDLAVEDFKDGRFPVVGSGEACGLGSADGSILTARAAACCGAGGL